MKFSMMLMFFLFVYLQTSICKKLSNSNRSSMRYPVIAFLGSAINNWPRF